MDFSEATGDNVVCKKGCINKVKLDLLCNKQISAVIIIIIVVAIALIDDNNNSGSICSNGGSGGSSSNIDDVDTSYLSSAMEFKPMYCFVTGDLVSPLNANKIISFSSSSSHLKVNHRNTWS